MTGTIGACTASIRVGNLTVCIILGLPRRSSRRERRRVAPEAFMIRRRTLLPALAIALLSTFVATAAGTLQTPEQFLGFKVGADNKLIRWDRIVDYMKLAATNSDRVRFRELGKTSDNNPFIALEISSPDTLKNLDHYKQLEQK